jgi:hypothetical protein
VIRFSTRFAAALLLIAGSAAALRVAVLRDARGADACASPGALKATSLIPGTVALGERLEALGGDTIQWSEGDVPNPVSARVPMRFQLVRSFDAPALYADPIALASREEPAPGREPEPAPRERHLQPEELRLAMEPTAVGALPIHLAWDHTEAPAGPSRLVAWYFAFDGVPVTSPLRAQLASAWSLAVRGPRPLTLVTLSAIATQATAARVEAAAVAWLRASWEYTARACAPR